MVVAMKTPTGGEGRWKELANATQTITSEHVIAINQIWNQRAPHLATLLRIKAKIDEDLDEYN